MEKWEEEYSFYSISDPSFRQIFHTFKTCSLWPTQSNISNGYIPVHKNHFRSSIEYVRYEIHRYFFTTMYYSMSTYACCNCTEKKQLQSSMQAWKKKNKSVLTTLLLLLLLRLTFFFNNEALHSLTCCYNMQEKKKANTHKPSLTKHQKKRYHILQFLVYFIDIFHVMITYHLCFQGFYFALIHFFLWGQFLLNHLFCYLDTLHHFFLGFESCLFNFWLKPTSVIDLDCCCLSLIRCIQIIIFFLSWEFNFFN